MGINAEYMGNLIITKLKMDNLSRTEKDLRPMSIEYLNALKHELEEVGTKKLL